MGNTVSTHICQIKVFRPYPVILYRLRLDHFIHCWKKWVSLVKTKFGILDGKASTHVWPNPQLKSMEILFLLISPKLRSLDPTLLYCIDSDWTTLSIGGKKWVSLRMNIFGVLHGKVSTHVWQNPEFKSMGNTVSAHICQIKFLNPTL